MKKHWSVLNINMYLSKPFNRKAIKTYTRKKKLDKMIVENKTFSNKKNASLQFKEKF